MVVRPPSSAGTKTIACADGTSVGVRDGAAGADGLIESQSAGASRPAAGLVLKSGLDADGTVSSRAPSCCRPP